MMVEQPAAGPPSGTSPRKTAAKGPIAALREGDIIEIDIIRKTLNFRLSQVEVKRRLSALPKFEHKIKGGYLGRYAELVASADKGAVFPR